MSEIKKYDVAIVGGAAAGLTAAIYTSRKALKTLVITKDIGGQASMAGVIENYPGFLMTDGPSLMLKFKEQAEKVETEFLYSEVVEIKKDGEIFIIKTNTDEIHCLAVILAFGLTPRDLGVPGESQLKGRGVAHCATCDGPLYKGKVVAVVGGGNSALEAVDYLARLASKVYLVHRQDKFRGDAILVQKMEELANLEKFLNAQIVEFKGDKKLEAMIVRAGEESKEVAVDGVFLEIGYEAKTGFVKNLVEMDERGQVKVNEKCETSTPGVFAAGDVTTLPYKQVVISAGAGAKAGISAYNYISKNPNILPDWH